MAIDSGSPNCPSATRRPSSPIAVPDTVSGVYGAITSFSCASVESSHFRRVCLHGSLSPPPGATPSVTITSRRTSAGDRPAAPTMAVPE